MQERPQRVPAHVAIARVLGTQIVTGAIAPGSLLPSENVYSVREGVSRSVIREAMRMLMSKRLIESRPKLGTRVRARCDWNLLDPDVLQWSFASTPDDQFVRDLFDLRLILEPAAAALAASNRDSHQLTLMARALEKMARYGLATSEGLSADQCFHDILFKATGNALLANLSSSISAAVRWTTSFKYRNYPPRDPLPLHRDVFEALLSADPQAAKQAMATLVEQARLDTEAVLISR